MIDRTSSRWRETFGYYRQTISLLTEAVDLAGERALSELEKAGLIQRFENAWEMGWKTLADYLAETEDADLPRTPGSATRLAAKVGLIVDGDAWLKAGQLRNVLSHEYSRKHRDEGLLVIEERFLPMMKALAHRLELV